MATISSNANHSEIAAVPASPFPQLMNSNVPPSPLEANILRTIISNAQSDIRRINNPLQREAIQEHVRSHEAILSAVRRLSPKLLGRIFEYCIPELADTNGWHIRAGFRAQMLPSHICSDWRNVALSTPSLWSSFRLDMEQWLFTGSVESLTALVTTWLGRTHGYPLAFVLEGYQTGPLLAALLPFCESWEDVSIRIPRYMFNHLTSIKGHLPRLKRLTISEGSDESLVRIRPLSSQQPSQPIHFFEEAPKLRHVGISSSWVVVVLRLPLGQLTKCSLRACTIERCLNILEHCPLLQEFEVFLEPSSQGLPGMRKPSAPITLLYLESLIIYSNIHIGTFFEFLRLPALKSITYDDYGPETGQFPHNQFISLLSRSSCALHNLKLDAHTVGGDALLECLHYTPSLRSLSCALRNYSYGGRRFLDGLVCRLPDNGQSSSCVVPELQGIKLFLGKNFEFGRFADMIRTRWTFKSACGVDCEQIQDVVLAYSSDEFESIMRTARAELETLRACGLRVYIENESSRTKYLLF